MHARLALLVGPSLLLAACSDAGVTKFNADPSAEISSHASGETVREGYPETLRGTVGDADDDLDQLSVSWLVDGILVCPESAPDTSGVVLCEHAFAPTGGVVVLEVRDPSGGSGSARVTLDVQATDAPEASIAAPTADGVYYSDQLVTFEGTVADGEDDPGDLVVAWESSIDGALEGGFGIPDSEGGLLGAATLSEGEHFVTLTATDSTGKEGRDGVTIQVGPPNSAPTCGITAPVDGGTGEVGASVRFEATVGDVDVPADWLTVTWESDVDGELRQSTPSSAGEVVFATDTLSAATHTITLTATDEVGATCTDLVLFTVGHPPVLTVTAPASGDTVNEGEDVAFTATVADADDLATSLALSWSSDVDGVFSTQGADSAGAVAFTSDALSPGAHVLTVRATDPDGLFDEATLDLRVNRVPTAPTVGLSPDPATTDDTLTATASGSVDPDGSGTVTYTYAWTEDGTPSSASTGSTFPSASTTKHRTYRVVVTPTDGTGSGPTGEAEVTVVNSSPVLTGPSLSASTVQVGDVLTCTASATDADPADTPAVAYAWQDGSTGATYTVTSADDPGDVLTCTATADDGDGGTASASASATVVNSPPVISGLSLTPTTATTDDTLSISATATDPDGDTVSLTYDWYVNSSLVLSGTAATLDGSSTTLGFDKGDVVYAAITASDGTDTSSDLTASITILNSPPTAPVVTIDPGDPVVGEDLWCEVTTASTDADGDPITYTMDWTVDSVAWSSALTTAWTDDTIDGADPVAGEIWACTATPDDGTDAGATASDDVQIGADSSFTGTFVLSERNAYRTWAWTPSVSASALTTYHSQRSNDTDCNADVGTTDYYAVEHFGDGIYRNSTKIVSTPYAYPKHVALFNGGVVVMSRNDCTLQFYTFAGSSTGSLALGCTEGQGVATDGTDLYVSLWNGSTSSFKVIDAAHATVATHNNPSGLGGNNIFDMAYDSDSGDWIGLVTSGEGGTGTQTSSLVRFDMGGSVTQSWTLGISMDGIGLDSCP